MSFWPFNGSQLKRPLPLVVSCATRIVLGAARQTLTVQASILDLG